MQRVFIGIPVDRQAQQRINQLLNPIKKSIQDVRWVPEHKRHLTLAFLGNRPAWVIENIIQLMDKAYQQEASFKTAFPTLTRFPQPTGNIMALGFETETRLSYLFQITQRLLAESGIVCDCEPFRPHITLGRIKKASSLKKKFNQPININLQIDKITLYQSTLTETGSIYLPLKEIELGQADNQDR